MTSFADLPAAALRLIARAARTRYIPGTNRYAQVCRSWQDATINSEDQEQLQLLLALDGLPEDTVASTFAWLAQHGACVTSLNITWDPTTIPLLRQLPWPLVGLSRLELDAPDSVIWMADNLPPLVALTHLRAAIGLTVYDSVDPDEGEVPLFSAEGGEKPLGLVPALHELCPGLRSLHLVVDVSSDSILVKTFDTCLSQLLPAALEQLHLETVEPPGWGGNRVCPLLTCSTLTSFSSLRRLTLTNTAVDDPNLLLSMPGLDEIDMCHSYLYPGYICSAHEWIEHGLCTTPQRLTSLTGMLVLQSEPRKLMPAPLLTVLSHVRKLGPVSVVSDAVGCVQQLSCLSGLQHLSLAFNREAAAGNVTAAMSALSSVQQLTYLSLLGRITVPRMTWAAVLPSLTKLQVLAVHQLLMNEDLAAEVPRLVQLQCLYVHVWAGATWGPATSGAQLVPHLQVLSQCSSLKAVLCWGNLEAEDEVAGHPMWVFQHSGRLHLSCWHKWRRAAEQGWVVWPRPCPHLPGVWEVQQQEEQAHGVAG
jgi:hypothetical protein